MPQLTTIVLKDGAATPVSHTFSPTGINASGVAQLDERVSGVPIGYPQITWSQRAPSSGSATYKLTGKLTQPKVVTVTDSTGAVSTVVDHSNLGTIELVVSSKSTKQERTDLRVLVSNLLLDPSIIACVDNLEQLY